MRMSYWSSDVCSSDRGTAVMKAAAEGLRDVSFELGGKNSAIIFADADLDAAIEGIVRSVFLNCGQVCLGTERVLVERPLFDRFVSALKAKAERSEERRVGKSVSVRVDLGGRRIIKKKSKVIR